MIRKYNLLTKEQFIEETIKLQRVTDIVCEHYKIADYEIKMPDNIISKNNKGARKSIYVEPRQIAVWLYRIYLRGTLSLTSIGIHFGGRDHSTMINSYQVTEDRMSVNKRYSDNVNNIIKKIDLFYNNKLLAS